jgi:hypothetical protein
VTTRLQKLNQRLNGQGLRALPAWAANWAYWNAHLYRLPGAAQLRAQLKYRKAHKKFNIDTPIIVFQMGKVGSSSVYDALRDLDLDVPVYHSHVLNRFDEYEEGIRRTRAVPENSIAALEAGRALRRIVDSERWKTWSLVSLVRAPIPRAISDFFENVDAYIPDFWTRWRRGEIVLNELNEIFWTRFHDYSLIHWFDDQVRDVFGMDVFAKPFPHARGYTVYQNETARLLLLRLEDLNNCGSDALQEFLGLDGVPLALKNSGSSKAYGALYREFVAQLRLPHDYVQEMHRSRYARHFYTQQELENSITQWIR